MRIFPALVSIFLTPLLTLTPVLAQSPEPTTSLDLHVVEAGAPDRLAVEIVDSAGNRVPGATVVVRLPEGAIFSNSSNVGTVQSDTNGVAHFEGIHWGPGGTVRITASMGNAHAGLLVGMPPAANAPRAPVPAPATPQSAPVPVAVLPPPAPAEKKAPQPGIIVENDDSPYANVPIRSAVAEGEGGFLPKMSIVSNGKSSSDHHMRNRVLIGLAVAAGAGAAYFLVHDMHSSSSSSSGTSIGPPTVSVGHP